MILIDPPRWPAHGRLWSHLASDTSLAELHAFSRRQGIPARAFETDHYDVPQERYDTLVAAGALPVATRDLLAALQVSGIRRPRRKGEEVIASHQVPEYLPGSGPCRIDVLTSPLPVPVAGALPGWWLHTEPGRVLMVRGADGWRLPGVGDRRWGDPVGCVRVRVLGRPHPHYQGPLPWVFRPALRPPLPPPGSWVPVGEIPPHPVDADVWPLVRALTEPALT